MSSSSQPNLNLYRIIEDDNSDLGNTVYYELNQRLPTFVVSPLIEGRSEQHGVYQMKIDKRTVAVLDFAMPGGLITFGNQAAIAMGLFMDYAALDRETNTRTFSFNKHPFTWKLYPKLGRAQKSFECREGVKNGVIAHYEPDRDQPEDKHRAVFRVSEGTETFLIELLCSLIIVRHNMKFFPE